MQTLKLTQIGHSVALILPEEVLSRLKLEKGDSVILSDTSDGVTISRYAPDVEQQLAIGREFMQEYQETFQALAK